MQKQVQTWLHTILSEKVFVICQEPQEHNISA